MYNPSICLDIISKASPVSVSRIKSYATLYTCQLWAKYQSDRALRRMYDCPDKDTWTVQLYYLDRAKKTGNMAATLLDAVYAMEERRPGESVKDWRNRRKEYQRMAEIIRRHWDASTGLFTWGNVTYGV